ncbi:MAG TPA: hypothetical protein VKZ43_02455 [Trueperaceae bacterium]|nr:hypothetical protein [Trueperaceae bacterium]
MSVWGDAKLLAFDDEQLEIGATGVDAALAIGLGAGRLPYGFDFDEGGNLWVGTQGGELLKFAAADVATSGTPTPIGQVTTGALHVAGVRIAPDGSLWATVEGKVVGWRVETLATGGAPDPDVTIPATLPAMAMYTNDLAFDDQGGLWLVGVDAILRFSPEQLATGVVVAPDVVIASDGTSLAGPRGLAFDASGDLWVSSMTSGVVEKFRRQDLTASGAPTPVVALSAPGTYKMRVAFDGDDNMWVSSLYGPAFGPSGYVAMISPPNRVSSGPASASVEFAELGSIDAGGAMVFNPGPG